MENTFKEWISQVKGVDEGVLVLGNFSNLKKHYNIPQYLLNPMTKEDTVAYLVAHGKSEDIGVYGEYKFTRVNADGMVAIWVSRHTQSWFLLV